MTPTPDDIRKAREIVDRFSFSSNVIVNGRMVGMQVVVADAIAQALASEREAALPEGCVPVPQSALDWLFGEGPDPDGHWFGDNTPVGAKGAFWWRSVFRKLIRRSEDHA